MLFLLALQPEPETRLLLSDDVSLRQWHPLQFYYFHNIKKQENGILKSNSPLDQEAVSSTVKKKKKPPMKEEKIHQNIWKYSSQLHYANVACDPPKQRLVDGMEVMSTMVYY